MKVQIDIMKKTRAWVLESIKDLTVEQMNRILPGFNNNIVWNLGHLVAAQQGVCYVRNELKTVVEQDFFDNFKPGSKPSGFISETEIKTIKELLFSSLDQLQADIDNNVFANYKTWTTRYGMNISNIEDALAFLPFHDGLHTDTITTMKKMLIQA